MARAKARYDLLAEDRSAAAFRSFNRRLGVTRSAIAGIASVVGAGVFARFVSESIETLDTLTKLSQQTGIATERLGAFALGAELGGAGLETFRTATRRLSQNLLDAERGLSTAQAGFRALGIETRDSEGNIRAVDDVLIDIADRFSEFEDGATKAAIANTLLGRSGAQLIPFLNQGAEGFRELEDLADRLGLTFSGPTGRAAEQFRDNLTLLRAANDGLFRQLSAQLLPGLNQLTDRFVDFVSDGDQVRETARRIGAGFSALSTAASVVGQIVVVVGEQIGATLATLDRFRQGAIDIVSRTGSGIAAAFKGEFANALDEFTTGIDDAGEDVGQGVSVIGSRLEDLQGRLAGLFDETADTTAGLGAETDKARALISALSGSTREAADNFAGLTDENNKAAASMNEAARAAERQKAQLDSLIGGLQVQVETIGLSSEELARYNAAALGADETTQALAASLTAQAEAQQAQLDKMSEASEIIERFKDDNVRAREEIEQLQNLLDEGLIDPETFRRARAESLEGFAEEAEEEFDQIEQAADRLKGSLKSALSDEIRDPSIDSFRDLADAFEDTLSKMVADALAANLVDSLFGGSGGAQSTGAGDLFSAGLGALFGGGRQFGGPTQAGRVFRINESEPEFFIPPGTGGRVARLGDPGVPGGTTQHNVFHISVAAPNGQVAPGTGDQLGRDIAAQLSRSQRNS